MILRLLLILVVCFTGMPASFAQAPGSNVSITAFNDPADSFIVQSQQRKMDAQIVTVGDALGYSQAISNEWQEQFESLHTPRGPPPEFVPVTYYYGAAATSGFAGTEYYIDTDATDRTVTGGTIAQSNDVYTKTAHGFHTGDAVLLDSLTGGTGLTAGNTYYVNVLSSSTAEFCSTFANAEAGTQINVTVDASNVNVTHLGYSGGTGAVGSKWASLREAIWSGTVNTALSSAAVRINAIGTSEDNGPCTQITWNNITNCTAAHYLEIYGDNRSGNYSTSKYRLVPPVNTPAIYNNEPPFLWFYYAQARVGSDSASAPAAFRLTSNNVGTGGSGYDCGAFGVYVQLYQSGSGRPLGFNHDPYDGTGTCKMINCIVHETTADADGCVGFEGTLSGITIDSCLTNARYYGYTDNGAQVVNIINSVYVGPTPLAFGFGGTFDTSTSNFSEDGSEGTTFTSGTTTFMDKANGDYHLNVTDTNLKGQGSTTQTLDIDGQTRGTPDDAGPDDQQ